MKRTLTVITISTLVVLSGCGMIDENLVSQETLQDKASYAIGATPEKITISDINSDISKVTFNATANDTLYRCYYTTAIAVKSDAVCTKMNGETGETTSNDTQAKQCNALLKAAGQCN